MSEEVKLTVTTSGQYKNMKLNEKGEDNKPILKDDNYVVVEKLFSSGLEKESKHYKDYNGNPQKYWIFRVKYDGHDDVSFFINKKNDADALNNLGDVGDKIKITGYREEWTNPKTGVDMLLQRFKFELL